MKETPPEINPDDADDKFYSTTYIANLFGVTPETVRIWIEEGKLQGRKINKRYMVRRRDLIAFANSRY